jgi:hypothetical protein
MPRARLLLILAGAAAVVLLFVILRPGGDEDDESLPATTATATTSTANTAPTTAPTKTTASTTTAPQPQATVLRITVRAGRPVGGIQRASTQKGEAVRVIVRSDVADHVHLHGYDVMRDVGPGRPAQIAVRATLTGRFEIELEERGLEIGELEVRP